MDYALGPGAVSTEQLAALHDLGFLPIRVKQLPEGSRVPLRIPTCTVRSTRGAKTAYVASYIESQLSAEFWKTPTNATTAYEFRRMLTQYCAATGGDPNFIRWQGHNFAFRGMSGVFDATMDIGHASCFTGTDSISTLDYLEWAYMADASMEMLGGSVPATEHGVVTMNGPAGEVDFVKRLITELYPRGVVSHVSDSYDYWWMATEGLRQLKPTIMGRQPDMFGLNKFVIRPDSGDPVKIMMGDPKAPQGSPEQKGTLRCLLDVFDPETTATHRTKTGHWMLDPHIGTIYGDAISLERGTEINRLMAEQGFCSSNSVYGIGSYTYQLVSRDTFNHAYKTTNAVVSGESREMFKDPKTGDGMKKSARGYLRVEIVGSEFVLFDQQTPDQEAGGMLHDCYIEGQFPNMEAWRTIRERLIPGFYEMA
jgi:nicotinamide phosphoribosyltransferase